jgi:hypothetical protein
MFGAFRAAHETWFFWLAIALALVAAADRPLSMLVGQAWATTPPEWAIAPIILLLVWGFMRSNYRNHEEQLENAAQLQLELDRLRADHATHGDWSATTFSHRTISIRDIPLEDRFFLRGKTFEDCLIQGPVVLFPVRGVELRGVQHGGSDRELVFAIPDGSTAVIGAVGLEFVAFRQCRFEGVAFCVPSESVEQIRDALAGRHDLIPKAE